MPRVSLETNRSHPDWKGPVEVSCPTSGHRHQVAQGFVQLRLEYLKELCGLLPLPVLDLPHDKIKKRFSLSSTRNFSFPVASHCAPLRSAWLRLLCTLPFGICRQQQDLPFAFSSPGRTNAAPSTSTHTSCVPAPKHLGPSGPPGPFQ